MAGRQRVAPLVVNQRWQRKPRDVLRERVSQLATCRHLVDDIVVAVWLGVVLLGDLIRYGEPAGQRFHHTTEHHATSELISQGTELISQDLIEASCWSRVTSNLPPTPKHGECERGAIFRVDMSNYRVSYDVETL